MNFATVAQLLPNANERRKPNQTLAHIHTRQAHTHTHSLTRRQDKRRNRRYVDVCLDVYVHTAHMFSRCETCPICINMWSKSEFAQKKIERKKKLCGKLRVLNGLFIGTPNKNTQWIWQLKQIRFILFFFSLSSRLSFTFFLVVDSLESKFVCAFVYSNTTHTHVRIIWFWINFSLPFRTGWTGRIEFWLLLQ